MTLSAREAVEHYGFEGAVRYFVWLSEEYPLHARPWQGLADLALMQGDESLASLLSKQAKFLEGGTAVPVEAGPSQPFKPAPSKGAADVDGTDDDGMQAHNHRNPERPHWSQPMLVDTNLFRHSTMTMKDVAVAVFWIGLTLCVIVKLSCERQGAESRSTAPASIQDAPTPRLAPNQQGPAQSPNPKTWYDPPGIYVSNLRGWSYLSSFKDLSDRYSLLVKSETEVGVQIFVEVSKQPELRSPKEVGDSFNRGFRSAYKDKYRLISSYETVYGGHDSWMWTFSQLSKTGWVYKQDVLFKLGDGRLVAVLIFGPEDRVARCKSDFIDLLAQIGEDPGEAAK